MINADALGRAGPAMSDASLRTDDHDHAGETIALLQEEVARLEAEVRARDEALHHDLPDGLDGHRVDDGPLRRQVEELTAELAGRDETIGILLEQTRLFEEAAEAQRAEWEQLTRWVEEVERRVDGRDGQEARLGDDLEAERRRADDLGSQLDSERRAWDARRRALEGERDDLRRRLVEHADGAGRDGRLEALEQENHRLREGCAARGQADADTPEVGALRERLATALAEVEHARASLRLERDDRARERNEHEATLASLRSQLARDSLQRASDAGAHDPGVEADERIRAFRQHLQELHQREAEERSSRTLSARLSRLWRHTGPG
jgi:hypothetical protein